MKTHIEKMDSKKWGSPINDPEKMPEHEIRNREEIMALEQELERSVQAVRSVGIKAEELHKRGQGTVYERIDQLTDNGEFYPLNTLYNPVENKDGVGIVTGIGRVSGKYCVIIASQPSLFAGAWLPGHAEKIFRTQDMSETLRIPLVWLIQCSGIMLAEQDKLYAGSRSGGRIFYRNAELSLKGVPVVAGIFGKNMAGGGYHGISPDATFAHKDATMAVGGAGILEGTGMLHGRGFTLENAEKIIRSIQENTVSEPGDAKTHYYNTRFFREIFDTEEGVLNAVRSYISRTPGYAANHFKVREYPRLPMLSDQDIYYTLPKNQQWSYNIRQVLARIFDGNEHIEYRPEYGPEVYCGLAVLDGFLTGIVANIQGTLPSGYPRYSRKNGIGGKLYDEGLKKMAQFVTECSRDGLPMIWFQDTTSIDVGDEAEEAELLGLGQSLIYSIEQSKIPMATIVLRNGMAASHYVMAGPQASGHNVFALGTVLTKICVMYGETAAVATFSRRLAKAKAEGKALDPIIDEMNKFVEKYKRDSQAIRCAEMGLVDEIVTLYNLRGYLTMFIRAAHQNPAHICPPHLQMLIRTI